jgi:uncharacterized protein YndB with AHSA1/START domain
MFISAPPEDVFALLSDPASYPEWVVGTREVRDADEHWPDLGAVMHHSVGIGPFVLRDITQVTDVRAPMLLELRAKARPLGVARVAFELEPEGNGTRVRLVEEPSNRLLSVLIGPIGHATIRLRNAETLRRLGRLAEQARPPTRRANSRSAARR